MPDVLAHWCSQLKQWICGLVLVFYAHQYALTRYGTACTCATARPSAWLSARPFIASIGMPPQVGMIDTGIDYKHPDLGGCFGQGCRVAFGYDFVGGELSHWLTTWPFLSARSAAIQALKHLALG
jgi:hypothetical protein